MYKSIVKTVYKVSDFISWQRNGSLILSPSFQRRSVWPKAGKSFLIDTIVRGIPIPIIFLRERMDLKTLEPKREVVDGQQRLRTLFSYIDAKLITNYDLNRDAFTVKKSHNPEIADLRFDQLNSKFQTRILNYEFSVHVLPSDTEDREILQIFARMNATGIKLNKQELRNAEFIGEFKRSMYDLAYEQLNRWRDWGIFSENDIARMLEVEETSDFIRMMFDGLQGKSQPAMDSMYRKYEDSYPLEPETSRRFRLVMDKIGETIGDNLRSTQFSRKVLFHTLFTFYYDLMFGLKGPLDKRKPIQISSNIVKTVLKASNQIQQKRVSPELEKVLRGGTGNLESRKIRLEFLRKAYKSV